MLNRITILLFVLISVSSCSIGDTVKPRDVEGVWVLQTIAFDIKLVGEDAEQETSDFSDLNSQIVFNSDGTFTSSIDNTNELLEGLVPASSGTYRIVDKEFIELVTSENGGQITTKLGIRVVGNEMTFKFTKELYRELIENEFAALSENLPDDVNVQELIDETLASIEYFNVTYTFIGA